MNQNVITVDLQRTDLYGWEGTKPLKAVDYMLRVLKAGRATRPVKVIKTPSGLQLAKYREDPHDSGLDGGHKRAVAYFIAGKPLPCVMWNNAAERTETTRIEDIILVSDSEFWETGAARRWYNAFERANKGIDFSPRGAILSLPQGKTRITTAEAAYLVRMKGGLEGALQGR